MYKRNHKYWIKMRIFDGIDNSSWVLVCKHVGEIKLFGYILSTFNQNDNSWNYDKLKQEIIEKHFNIKPSTQFKYLKNLVKYQLLFKIAKGKYVISGEYIQYGKKSLGFLANVN